MFLTEPSSVAVNATNSSQDRVGGEVGLLLSHLIYINYNAASFFSWCFFFSSQSELFGKKLSNLHLAAKKRYEEGKQRPMHLTVSGVKAPATC